MRRRAFLAALGLGASASAIGSASAHPTASGGTPPDTTPHNHGADPLGRLPLPDAAEAVVGPDGTTVYVATMDGFAVVDTSDPGDPNRIASVDGILDGHDDGPMTTIQDVKVAGDRLLVVGPANPRPVVAAAVLYDVGDPSNPQRVAVHETDYPIHNSFLTERHAYLTANGADGNRLVIRDARDGLGEVGRWSLVDVDETWGEVAFSLRVLHDVWVRDERAYVAHWDAGTWILDVADPTAPTVVTRVRGRPAEELAEIQVQAEVQREAVELPGNDHFVTVNDDGTLLGIGVEAWDVGGDANGGPGGIDLYDIGDPTEPTQVGRIHPPPTPNPTRDGVWTTAHNFELTADHCYSSWYQGGVRVHDVSDPADPTEVYAWRDASTTRFWTARRARPGATFVASSMGIGGEETATADGSGESDASDGEPALYVFPDPVEAENSPTAGQAMEPEPTGASGPGIGPLAALAGGASLAIGAGWRRLRGE